MPAKSDVQAMSVEEPLIVSYRENVDEHGNVCISLQSSGSESDSDTKPYASQYSAKKPHRSSPVVYTVESNGDGVQNVIEIKDENVDDKPEIVDATNDYYNALKKCYPDPPQAAMVPCRDKVPPVQSAKEQSKSRMMSVADNLHKSWMHLTGQREQPRASELRLVIGTIDVLPLIPIKRNNDRLDLILLGVGKCPPITEKCARHAIWNRLNTSADKGLRLEQRYRFQWMTDVFSDDSVFRSKDRVWPQAPSLLRRPVEVTVRPVVPIQQPKRKIQKRTRRQRIKEEDLLNTPAAAAVRGMAMRPSKRRRRSGSAPATELDKPVPSKSGAVYMEPLAYNQFTLGNNRSLSNGVEKYELEIVHRNLLCVEPAARMSSNDLKEHLDSLQSDVKTKMFDQLNDVLSKLMSDQRNRQGVFNTPVDPIALDIPHYLDIISHPMDLGTVKTKLMEGTYLEVSDFEKDVRLVFENAKRFNPPNHPIHVNATVLADRFEKFMTTEQEKMMKKSKRHAHVCETCRGHTCFLCSQQCLASTPPHLTCTAIGCGMDIKKDKVYYLTSDGTRLWCNKCYSKSIKGEVETGDVSDLSQLEKKKCQAVPEPWVKCSDCCRWLHQVCGLYNPVAGAYESEHTYICPMCTHRQKQIKSLATPDCRSLFQQPETKTSLSCQDMPECELSDFIQKFVKDQLTRDGHEGVADTLYVRALSFPEMSMALPENVVQTFRTNADALGNQDDPHRLPTSIDFLSRGLFLFQRQDGVDVCLFTVFAQEFGDSCQLEANRRAVYIAYVDSIRYFRPASTRTITYHLVLQAYFDYARRQGFERIHIWSCPPQRRMSYVFWCRPPFQKTPSAEHLRDWYKKLLQGAQDKGIVGGWGSLYDRYFDEEVQSSDPGTSAMMLTRGVTAKQTDPMELQWPASQLPPIFDGDFIIGELERIYGRIKARNAKVNRPSEYKKVEVVFKSEQQDQVEVKMSEVYSKLRQAVHRLRHDLLVVDLAPIADGGCAPKEPVPAWWRQVPRLFGSRFMFHQLCSNAGYQFDSLRRAKHSSMMLLHHFFNEQVPQANVFCTECNLLITRAEHWKCTPCRYITCDACYRQKGSVHAHGMEFGKHLL